MTIRCGIIGAGNIGWRYDGGVWDGERSVSHASCIARHSETTLVALMDPIATARDAFTTGCATAKNVAICENIETFFDQNLDLVAIASPSQFHAENIAACFGARIPRILIEKPVTLNLVDFVDVEQKCRNLSTPPRIVVNFFRRFLPQFNRLKTQLDTVQGMASLVINYSRRLDVNGVHMLDLIGFLFDIDEPPALEWVTNADTNNPSFGIMLEGVSITVLGQDLPFHALDIRLMDDRGRMSVIQGGCNVIWEARENNPNYPGFFHLALPEVLSGYEDAPRQMRDGTYLALCNLVDDRNKSLSPLKSAYFSQALMAQILQEKGAT